MDIFLLGLLGGLVGWGIHRLADELPKQHKPYWRIPYRLYIVSVVNALLYMFLWFYAGATVRTVLALIYTAIFLLVLVIDYEYRLILNVVSWPAIGFAALASPLTRMGWQLSLLGGVVAFGFVFLIYHVAPFYARWRKIHLPVPFGFGDVMLAAFMGIVTGFPACVFALALAIVLAGLVAIGMLVYQYVHTRRIDTGVPMAYGPYFCIAGWVFMVFGVWWMR